MGDAQQRVRLKRDDIAKMSLTKKFSAARLQKTAFPRTLMPPSQRLLSTRIRGFVCKSCLSKLHAPRRQQLPWAIRTFASDDKPRKGVWDLPHGSVRYFEQTPDGARTEIKDEEDDEYTESVRKRLRELQERTGKTVDDLDDQDLQELLRGTLADTQGEDAVRTLFEDDPSQDPAEVENILKEMAAHDQELQAGIDLIKSYDLENLSDEDRVRLREAVLASVKNGMKKRYIALKLLLIQSIENLPGILNPNRTDVAVVSGEQASNESNDLTLPISSFPAKSHTHLRVLEQCVNNASPVKPSHHRRARRYSQSEKPAPDDAVRIRSTWKAYTMCRNALISTSQVVSPKFWTALWEILGKEDIRNLDRMPHLMRLGGDMLTAGFQMSDSQKLLYIEATFVASDQANAIQTWEAMGMTSTTMTDNKEYWDLGTRMFSRHGLIDRAISCAENILDHTDDPRDYRLLLPIIGAVLKSEDNSFMQRAWALYIRLRYNIGNRIVMEDYDSLIAMFMGSNLREQALSIFKDMMLTDATRRRREDLDSISRYTKNVGKSAVLSSMKIHPSELDWEDFRLVDRLPPRLENPIFFASWMKKLIGEGDVESAEKVFYLMQEHRVRPNSISINGLIGAWYRKGTEKYREKADALAWRMIEERKVAVKARRSRPKQSLLIKPVRLQYGEDLPDYKSVSLTPYATIETFSILLQQYRQRQKFDRIPALFEALQHARIRPNADFMNQMLLNHIKTQSPVMALRAYSTFTKSRKSPGSTVQPNLDTFMILWEMMADAADPVNFMKEHKVQLQHPRVLFRNMMPQLLRELRGKPLPNELYQTIILCFCQEKDQVGTAVALRALQVHFGNYPTEVTARAIVLQTARLGLVNEVGKGPRRLEPDSAVSKQRIQNVTQALGVLKERRAAVLREQGIDLDGLEGNAKLEETLGLLLQLLRYGYENKPVSGAELPPAHVASRIAALRMGVKECVVWDV